MLAPMPPVPAVSIGTAAQGRSVPAHICVHVPRTQDELQIRGATAHYLPPVGVFYVRGLRVVATYTRATGRLCNRTSRSLAATWES